VIEPRRLIGIRTPYGAVDLV